MRSSKNCSLIDGYFKINFELLTSYDSVPLSQRGAEIPLMPTQIPIKWIPDDTRIFSVFNDLTHEADQSHLTATVYYCSCKGREFHK